MSTDTPHHLGHRSRLRERMLRDSSSLLDYELLELLLGYALVRKDTKPIAKELLKRFGSIRGVFHAQPEELLEILGVGEGVRALLSVIRETMIRYAEAPTRIREQLCTPQSVARMVLPRLSGCTHEELWLATVDNKNQQLGWDRIATGSSSSAPYYPRDILERVFQHKGTGFILVHNHPSGEPTPSPQDERLTDDLQKVAERLGIRLLDHIIVGDGICYSICQGGVILP